MASQSRTRELYQWLDSQGYLWMLEAPFDERLSTFTGATPAIRMWKWKQRENVDAPGQDPPLHDSDVEQAFGVVEAYIRKHFC